MNLNILFGSQTGVSEEVSDVIANYAVACGCSRCDVQPMDAVDVGAWESLSPLILVCSTTGQGDPPETMRASWDVLRMSDCCELPLLRYAVFGLGDSSYAKYNFMGKMLHNRLRQLGGEPLVHRGLGDEQDAGGIWEGLEAFLRNLVTALNLNNEKYQSISASPPILKFRFQMSTPSTPLDMGMQRENTQTFTIQSTKRLTPEDHFQQINHIEFDRLGLKDYVCGDAVGIFPRSEKQVAVQVASYFGFSEDSTIRLTSAGSDTRIHFPRAAFLDKDLLVVELLRVYCDLEGCVPRSFFHCMKHFTVDEEERERLDELSSSSKQADYLMYCYREKRGVLEVLSEFPHCRVPFEYFLSHVKPMRPRYYSLSSSPSADSLCSVTVALFQITTPYGRVRKGLCSRWLCNAKTGDTFEGFVCPSASRVPMSQPKMPLILVGPGTGIAPLRSIVREAVVRKWTGTVHLFTGCRSPTKDFLYQTEWEKTTEIDLRVHTAFSRHAGKKTYVQHRIVEDGIRQDVGKALMDGATVVVCGSAQQMPRDVERALTSVAQFFVCDGSEEDAAKFIKNCKTEGRYIQDTWS